MRAVFAGDIGLVFNAPVEQHGGFLGDDDVEIRAEQLGIGDVRVYEVTPAGGVVVGNRHHGVLRIAGLIGGREHGFVLIGNRLVQEDLVGDAVQIPEAEEPFAVQHGLVGLLVRHGGELGVQQLLGVHGVHHIDQRVIAGVLVQQRMRPLLAVEVEAGLRVVDRAQSVHVVARAPAVGDEGVSVGIFFLVGAHAVEHFVPRGGNFLAQLFKRGGVDKEALIHIVVGLNVVQAVQSAVLRGHVGDLGIGLQIALQVRHVVQIVLEVEEVAEAAVVRHDVRRLAQPDDVRQVAGVQEQGGLAVEVAPRSGRPLDGNIAQQRAVGLVNGGFAILGQAEIGGVALVHDLLARIGKQGFGQRGAACQYGQKHENGYQFLHVVFLRAGEPA